MVTLDSLVSMVLMATVDKMAGLVLEERLVTVVQMESLVDLVLQARQVQTMFLVKASAKDHSRESEEFEAMSVHAVKLERKELAEKRDKTISTLVNLDSREKLGRLDEEDQEAIARIAVLCSRSILRYEKGRRKFIYVTNLEYDNSKLS